jgi:hypothetical protein
VSDSGDVGRAFLEGLREQQPKIAEAVRRARQDMIGAALKPTVGRVVHYVSHGSPVRPDGKQVYTSECRAAIITEVYDDDPVPESGVPYVGLCVLNPTGQFFSRGVLFDGHEDPAQRAAGSWHWPERTEP